MAILDGSDDSKGTSSLRRFIFNPFEMGEDEDGFGRMEAPIGAGDKSIFEKLHEIIAESQEPSQENAAALVGEKKSNTESFFSFSLLAEGGTFFVFNRTSEPEQPEEKTQTMVDKSANKQAERYQPRRAIKKDSTWKGFRGFVRGKVSEMSTFTDKNIVRQTPDAGRDLFEQIFGMPLPGGKKKEEKKPKTPEEAAKQAEDKAKAIAIYQAYRQIDEAIKDAARQEDEEIMKMAIGELGGVPSQEHAKIEGLNTSLDSKHLRTRSHIKSISRKVREEQKAAKKAQDQTKDQEIQKPTVNFNAVAEGGTGGGKVNISSTGGGGVG